MADGSSGSTSELIWSPPANRDPPSRLTVFRKLIVEEHAVHLDSYADLWRWSCEHPAQFWEAVWNECGIIGQKADKWEAGVSKGDALYPAPMCVSKLTRLRRLARMKLTHRCSLASQVVHG